MVWRQTAHFTRRRSVFSVEKRCGIQWDDRPTLSPPSASEECEEYDRDGSVIDLKPAVLFGDEAASAASPDKDEPAVERGVATA